MSVDGGNTRALDCSDVSKDEIVEVTFDSLVLGLKEFERNFGHLDVPLNFHIVVGDRRFSSALWGLKLDMCYMEECNAELESVGIRIGSATNAIDYLMIISAIEAFQQLYGHTYITPDFVIDANDTAFPIECRGLPLGLAVDSLCKIKRNILPEYQAKFEEFGLIRRYPTFDALNQAFVTYHQLNQTSNIPSCYEIEHGSQHYPREVWGYDLGQLFDEVQKGELYPDQTFSLYSTSVAASRTLVSRSKSKIICDTVDSSIVNKFLKNERKQPSGSSKSKKVKHNDANNAHFPYYESLVSAFKTYRRLNGTVQPPVSYVIPSGDTNYSSNVWGCALGKAYVLIVENRLYSDKKFVWMALSIPVQSLVNEEEVSSTSDATIDAAAAVAVSIRRKTIHATKAKPNTVKKRPIIHQKALAETQSSAPSPSEVLPRVVSFVAEPSPSWSNHALVLMSAAGASAGVSQKGAVTAEPHNTAKDGVDDIDDDDDAKSIESVSSEDSYGFSKIEAYSEPCSPLKRKLCETKNATSRASPRSVVNSAIIPLKQPSLGAMAYRLSLSHKLLKFSKPVSVADAAVIPSTSRVPTVNYRQPRKYIFYQRLETMQTSSDEEIMTLESRRSELVRVRDSSKHAKSASWLTIQNYLISQVEQQISSVRNKMNQLYEKHLTEDNLLDQLERTRDEELRDALLFHLYRLRRFGTVLETPEVAKELLYESASTYRRTYGSQLSVYYIVPSGSTAFPRYAWGLPLGEKVAAELKISQSSPLAGLDFTLHSECYRNEYRVVIIQRVLHLLAEYMKTSDSKIDVDHELIVSDNILDCEGLEGTVSFKVKNFLVSSDEQTVEALLKLLPAIQTALSIYWKSDPSVLTPDYTVSQCILYPAECWGLHLGSLVLLPFDSILEK